MEGATKFAMNKRKGFAFLLKNGEWTKMPHKIFDD